MTTTIDTTRYARIAVERGIDRYPDGLLYRIPIALDGVKGIGGVALGDHVTVPLGRGNSRVNGVVVGIGGDELLDKKFAVDRVKSILEIDRTSDPMPSVVVRLAQWIASYYCAPIGVTIAGITPSAVRKGVGRIQKIAVDIATPPESATTKVGRLHPKRQAVLDAVARLPQSQRPVDIDELRAACSLGTRAPILALIKSGHLQVTHRTSVQAKWRASTIEEARAPEPTSDQSKVIESVGKALNQGFSQHLLFGVTGSGKTEVYLRLAARVLAAGR